MVLYPGLVNLEIIILDCWTKFTLQEHGSDQAFSRKTAGGGYCWGRLQILDVLSHTHDSSSPANTGLFVDLHSYRESPLLYLNVFRINELSLLGSFIGTLQTGKLGKRCDLPEVTWDVWGPLVDAQLFSLGRCQPFTRDHFRSLWLYCL